MKPVPIDVVGPLALAGCTGKIESPSDVTQAGATSIARLKMILAACVAFFALGCANAQAQDMALNKPASASSTENNRTDLRPALANDGNSSTRWSSNFVDDQWWHVDLGSIRQIDRVELNWETAYASRYRIQTRTSTLDSWSTAETEQISSPGLRVHAFPVRDARYVRIQGDQRATSWGISLWDVRVFGPTSSPLPPDWDGGGVPDSPALPSPPDLGGGFPNASNTGPVGALQTQDGNLTVTTAGAVISGMQINGCVTVNAPNVTISNSRIRCAGPSAIWSGSTGLLVEDTEVDCLDQAGRTAITPRNYTARRVEASRCENIFWASSNVLIEDSYIHDPIPCCTATQPHTDSIQITEYGGRNITIRHNRIYGGYISQSNFGNAAIQVGFDVTDVLIQNNLLAGGGYALRLLKATNSNNLQVTNNRFSRIFVNTVGGFGPEDGNRSHADVWSGNVYHETGDPL